VPPMRSVPVLTPDALFNWAEVVFPQFFAGFGAPGFAGPYQFRFYSQSQNYLAVANGGVYVLGNLSNWQIVYVGAMSDFTCSVYDCSGGGGGQIDWNSAFSAEEIIDDGPTLAARARQGWSFNVTGGSLPVESIFAAQFSASLYVMSLENLSACVNGGSFSYYPAFSFANGVFGFMSFELPPGNYGVCLVNDSNASNATRVEFQNQLAVDGFHITQSAFDTIAEPMANGARIVQPVSVGDNYRVLVDGGNSGGTFYIIPADQASNFLAGNQFSYYPDMTSSCAANGRAAPGLCELTGVGEYAIAYVNDTGSPQSIVVTGRVYFPN
jgi:hypothetical protein